MATVVGIAYPTFMKRDIRPLYSFKQVESRRNLLSVTRLYQITFQDKLIDHPALEWAQVIAIVKMLNDAHSIGVAQAAAHIFSRLKGQL